MRLKRMINVVGAHAEGEVGNVITGGVVDLPGTSVFKKMEYLRAHDDLGKTVRYRHGSKTSNTF